MGWLFLICWICVYQEENLIFVDIVAIKQLGYKKVIKALFCFPVLIVTLPLVKTFMYAFLVLNLHRFRFFYLEYPKWIYSLLGFGAKDSVTVY